MTKPINGNYVQHVLYKSGVGAVASDIRKHDPKIRRFAADEAAREIAASEEVTPIDVRKLGVRRMGSLVAKTTLALGLSAGAVGLVNYGIDHSPTTTYQKNLQDNGSGLPAFPESGNNATATTPTIPHSVAQVDTHNSKQK